MGSIICYTLYWFDMGETLGRVLCSLHRAELACTVKKTGGFDYQFNFTKQLTPDEYALAKQIILEA